MVSMENYGYTVEALQAESERCSEVTEFYSELSDRKELFPTAYSELLFDKLYNLLNRINNVIRAMVTVFKLVDALGEEATDLTLLSLNSELSSLHSSLYNNYGGGFYKYITTGRK